MNDHDRFLAKLDALLAENDTIALTHHDAWRDYNSRCVDAMTAPFTVIGELDVTEADTDADIAARMAASLGTYDTGETVTEKSRADAHADVLDTLEPF